MKSFNTLLLELFDNPWKLEDITNSDIGNHIKNEIKNQYNKVSRYKLYKAEGNNGHIIEFHNINAMEIHHVDNNGVSGLIHNNSKPNPRYISTMLDKIRYHTLQKNRNVRIVSANKLLVNHYHRISKIVAKKEPVDVSDITEYDNKQSAFYITPKKNLPIAEIIQKYNNEINLDYKVIHLINEMVLKNQEKINVYSETNLVNCYEMCKVYADKKPIVLSEIQDGYFTVEPFVANKYEKIIEAFNDYTKNSAD